jgi:60 kDa SS-A/Ro ribonucleoprotein
MDYGKHLNPGKTPQSEPLDERQVKNSAGGFVYSIDDWGRLQRFLILGNEGGTYYASERKLTKENAACVERLLKVDGPRVVKEILDVSTSGRAPKNDPAIFALALCLKRGDEKTRQQAAAWVPAVCRTGTHLFTLAEATKQLGIGKGGWGPVVRRAFKRWYTHSAGADWLALQLIKYQQRNGWSHRDILRRARPKTTGVTQELLHYAVKGWPGIGTEEHPDPVLRRVWAFEATKVLQQGKEATPTLIAEMVRKYNLPRECVPTESLRSMEVWEALLFAGKHGMPLGALVRNLAKMTAVGLLAPLSNAVAEVVRRLRDAEGIKRARLHPLAVLLAQATYGSGNGERGHLEWKPVPKVLDALNEAFYLAFGAVVPTGKRRLIALDVSGSMSGGGVAGTSLSPRAASSALAMVTMRTEENWHTIGFTGATRVAPGRFRQRSSGLFMPVYSGGRAENAVATLDLRAAMSLDEVVAYTDGLPFGTTDCSLPMIYALQHKVPVDVFEIYTDNETWAGGVHPMVALREYRKQTGIAAKLVVVGMTSTGFTIADPEDAGSMDVVGLDAATPMVVNDFIRGGGEPAQQEEV